MADDLLFETGTGGDESQGGGGRTAATNTNSPVNPRQSFTPLDLVFGGDVNEDGVPQVYFGDRVEVNLEGAENLITGWSWVIEKPDKRLFTDPADDNKDILTFSPVALGFNEAGDYVIRVQFDETGQEGNNLASTPIPLSKQLRMLPSTNVGPEIVRSYAPFIAEITEVDDKIIKINQGWNTFKNKAGFVDDRDNPTNKFDNITISYKINDITDLNTFLHLGDNNKMLITNIQSDKNLFPDSPFSNVLKLYKPLDEDVQELDNVYVVKEVLPQITEVVDLYPYEQEEEELNVLVPPENPPKNSTIVNRQTKGLSI